jgi:MFS transporter, PPP family, 3-phenylpropionic acid transporter
VPGLLVSGLFATAIPGRAKVARTASMFRAPGTVLRHRPILLFLIGYLICFAALFSQASYLGPYMHSLGATNEAIGWAASIGAMFEVPVMFFFPRIAARFPLDRLIILGAIVLLIRYAVNAISTDPAILIAFAALQGLGFALLVVGGVAFVSREAPRGTAATAQGLLNGTAFSLAGILGMGIGGQIAALLTIRGLYVVSIGVGVVGLVAVASAVLRVPTPEDAPQLDDGQDRSGPDQASVAAESMLDAEATP